MNLKSDVIVLIVLACVMLFALPLFIGVGIANIIHVSGVEYWEVMFLPLLILWLVLIGSYIHMMD